MQDTDNSTTMSRAFLLLGLLANYNRFEFLNPYRMRFEDFINESNIQRLIKAFGASMAKSRNRYVDVQDDVAEGWTLSSTLAYIGLGVLAPAKPTSSTSTDHVKEGFGDLYVAFFIGSSPCIPANTIRPDPSVAILLGAYDFSSANKVFCYNLISYTAEERAIESPFSAFLSFTSYLLHHAYRSSRATLYGMLSLLILRIIIEDLALCKVLCDSEDIITIRLCRQRQPFLPATSKPRPSITYILDILVDTLNHNLRRHLDLQLYISTIGLLHRVVSYLAFTRTRLAYHWSLLWQTLISFLRFLTTYAPSISTHDPDLPQLLKPFLATLALAVTSGESFLPDPAAYDDLFYKLVEAGDFLTRFKQAFVDQISPIMDTNGIKNFAGTNAPSTTPIDLLIQVSAHYHDLVQEEREQGRLGNNPSPREVSKIVRRGYESLSLPAIEGLDLWDRFREGEERGMLKRAARLAVEDTRKALRRSGNAL